MEEAQPLLKNPWPEVLPLTPAHPLVKTSPRVTPGWNTVPVPPSGRWSTKPRGCFLPHNPASCPHTRLSYHSVWRLRLGPPTPPGCKTLRAKAAFLVLLHTQHRAWVLSTQYCCCLNG